MNERFFLPAVVVLGALFGESLAAANPPTKRECVSANEAAQDLQRVGKLQDARAQLLSCTAESCPAPVRVDCARRIAELDDVIPTLVIEAKDRDGNDLSAVRVTMDGQPFASTLAGIPISVDPGAHRFVFEADGFQRIEKVFVPREGDRNRHERVVLMPERAPSNTPATVPAETLAATPTPETPTEVSASRSTEANTRIGNAQRVLGLVIGGAGVAGLVIGGGFGLMSRSTYDHALNTECGGRVGSAVLLACNPSGYDDVQTARSQATAATVALIGGAALLGGGVLLYLAAPRGRAVSMAPALGPGTATLRVQGSW